MSIRSRILLLALLPSIGVAVILTFVILSDRSNEMQSRLSSKAYLTVDRLSAVSSLVDFSSDKHALEQLARITLRDEEVSTVRFIGNDKHSIVLLGTSLQLDQANLIHETVLNHGDRSTVITAPVNDPQGHLKGWIQIAFSKADAIIDLYGEVKWSLLLLSLSVVLALLLAMRTASYITIPLQRFATLLQRISQGEDVDVPTGSVGDLGTLEKSVKDLTRSIKDTEIELRSDLEQITQDYQETLDTIEMQNIELEKARKEAEEANRIKSEFLANLSDEIRTPLNGVIGFTNLLLRTHLSGSQIEYLATIRKSSESLLNSINNILEFSRIEAGKIILERVAFDLREAIDDVLSLLAPTAYEKKLEIIPLIHADLPVNISSDPLRFRQIVSNLVNSVIRFSEHGTILIEASLQIPASLQICITCFSKQQREKELFNAFTQADTSADRRVNGTGLGLAISKHLIARMDGKIDLESIPGQVPRIRFTIPLESHEDRSDTMLAGNRILYFDRQPDARQAMLHFINFYDMTGDTTETLDQLIDRAVDRSMQYEGLIIGLDQAAQISMQQITDINTLDLPVIFLLNASDQQTIAALKQQDLIECLPKPLSHAKLYKALCRHLPARDSYPRAAPGNDTLNFAEFRILAVDDNAANLKFVCALLDDLGVHVTTATDGAQAVALASQSRFDLIFMDVQMPGMDGVEATGKIHTLNNPSEHTPVIALTAHALPQEIENLLNAGMDDYIIKPVNDHNLRAMLFKWIRFDEIKQVEPTFDKDAGVDWELALRLAGGKKDLAEEMMSMLLSTLPDDLAQIKSAYDSDDLGSLKDSIHRLNGAIRYCGVPGLHNTIKDLETRIKQEKTDGLADTLQQLYRDAESLQDWAAVNNYTSPGVRSSS